MIWYSADGKVYSGTDVVAEKVPHDQVARIANVPFMENTLKNIASIAAKEKSLTMDLIKQLCEAATERNEVKL